MIKNARQVYSDCFVNAINEVCSICDNPIIVVYGDVNLIDKEKIESLVADPQTFYSLGGAQVFTKQWFSRLFSVLSLAENPALISYAQYSYLISYIAPDFFKNRTFILEDNMRRYFPIDSKFFISDTDEDDDSLTDLPIYQADQLKKENCFYYSAKAPNHEYAIIKPVFKEMRPLSICGAVPSNADYIDPYSDDNEIDLVLGDILTGQSKTPAFYVKHYDKQPKEEKVLRKLERINFFCYLTGREIFNVIEESLSDDFVPRDQLNTLLKQYWGPKAEFRSIRLYKNPNINSETIDVSQGKVVQTVIDEYENVKAGREYRDVFLTAPTGAGKSLLFQLPAFYISGKGDITIVISPLIALMKDQVNAIKSERHFDKVAYINSEISFLDREAIIEKCKEGEIDVLYMAPELLMSYDIRYFIGERNIGLIVIDEAHLITTWGRDFRVDYWYIGNHIRKIRKYSNQQFPMIAVTATAVFGGDKNDMVFDTVDSLVMHSPHYFIGIVKRDDIEFIINNYDAPEKGFDKAKLKQTTEFIKQVNELGFKTLVYAPYTDHVKKLSTLVNEEEEIAVQYYGASLDALAKDQAERQFRGNERNVMICTKAFGMGVDIPDIQVVYHHAPSGLLPDYVQEIGRAARQKDIKGYATLNYCQRDQRYSNQLYGMSSLRLWQLKAVLKKLYSTYRNNGNKRNMLVSIDDFAFAFEESGDVEQKVKTALMMIEKDYLMKYRFNVVIARPKQLFTKVYSKVSSEGLRVFNTYYKDCFTDITHFDDGSAILIVDLQKLWQEHYTDKSFPVLKHDYYTGKLLSECEVQPRLKLSYVFADVKETINGFKKLFEILKEFLVSTNGRFFEKELLLAALKKHYDDRTSKQIASFVLTTYSGEQVTFGGAIEENAFLQEKRTMPRQYRVFGSRYEGSFSSTLSLLAKLTDNESGKASRFVSKENSVPYVRIGHLIEILDLGTYEMRGGEAPMIFVRLNSPEIVKRDSFSADYSNILFDKTQEKHTVSTEILNHFFTHSFSNEERWNFIEDFFLGENNEELMRKYPGKEIIRTDIIKELKSKSVQKASLESKEYNASNGITYPPRSGKYMPKDHLTIDVEGENVTRTIKEWIDEDPISLHKLIKDKVIYVDSGCVYDRVMKTLEKNYTDYYNKLLGLRKMIIMPGVKEPTMAEVLMINNPVKFYKWWSTHRDEVFIPLKDKIWLISEVSHQDSSALKVADKKFLIPGSTIKR